MSSSAAELLAHEAFVARLARSLAVDESAAADLVQETWLAALEGSPAREPGLRSWLARVIRNLAASGQRSRTRRALRESACARPELQPDTGELVERVELHHRLVAAVLGLPEAYREVVLRHYFHGESVSAMARGLGRPEATVRTRLRRARMQLREQLGGRVLGDPRASFLTGLVTLDSAARWTSDWIMKKTLFQTPLLVGGLVGAGLGFSGSFLIRPAPAEGAAPGAALEAPRATSASAVASSDAQAPELVLTSPHRATPARREPAETSSASLAESSSGPPSSDELRRLLYSSDRLDQVRAIRLLLEEGTPAAHGLLLEAFLSTSDAILMALLEEAILESGADVAPAVLEAYRTSLDPGRLARLSSMMSVLVERSAELEPVVVELLLAALRDPGPKGERLAGIDALLARIDERALDALAEYLSDPLVDPSGVGIAVNALRNIATPGASDRVRERIGEVFDALVAAAVDPALSDEQRQAILERTSSIAWAATGRPPEEHDRLSEVLAGHLFRAADVQQAQTLAWGLSNLEGLSRGTRANLARSILEALPDQPDAELRQTYLWGVSQLVTSFGNRPLDQEFFDVMRLLEEHEVRLAHDPALRAQLEWLRRELERHREKKER